MSGTCIGTWFLRVLAHTTFSGVTLKYGILNIAEFNSCMFISGFLCGMVNFSYQTTGDLPATATDSCTASFNEKVPCCGQIVGSSGVVAVTAAVRYKNVTLLFIAETTWYRCTAAKPRCTGFIGGLQMGVCGISLDALCTNARTT